MLKTDPRDLIARAREAARHSYSPYSAFPVGAALLCVDGAVVTGANVENRSFGLACCAERTAVFTAVAQGKQEFAAIAVSAPSADTPVSPCGACRQVLGEFCRPDMPVYFAGKDDQYVTVSVGELLPHDSLHELKTRRP
jgi:cytidine deaminase